VTPTTASNDPVAFCGHCGGDVAGGGHLACTERLRMEPPRYCVSCARRMKVQVSPTSWTAECVEHGILASA
jgi:hypothetical protein